MKRKTSTRVLMRMILGILLLEVLLVTRSLIGALSGSLRVHFTSSLQAYLVENVGIRYDRGQFLCSLDSPSNSNCRISKHHLQ